MRSQSGENRRVFLQPSDREVQSWMDKAFDMAKDALENGEVPVGCLMVYNDEIFGKGRNEVNETKNCISGHREKEAVEILKMFYKQENPNAPKPKVRKYSLSPTGGSVVQQNPAALDDEDDANTTPSD